MSARVGQRVADAAPDQRVVVAEDDADHAAPSPGRTGSCVSGSPSLGVVVALGVGAVGASACQRHRQHQRRAARRRWRGRPSRRPCWRARAARAGRSCAPWPGRPGVRPRPLSLTSSDSTPADSDRSTTTRLACACLLMLVSASCANAVGHQRHARRQADRFVRWCGTGRRRRCGARSGWSSTAAPAPGPARGSPGAGCA